MASSGEVLDSNDRKFTRRLFLEDESQVAEDDFGFGEEPVHDWNFYMSVVADVRDLFDFAITKAISDGEPGAPGVLDRRALKAVDERCLELLDDLDLPSEMRIELLWIRASHRWDATSELCLKQAMELIDLIESQQESRHPMRDIIGEELLKRYLYPRRPASSSPLFFPKYSEQCVPPVDRRVAVKNPRKYALDLHKKACCGPRHR